jgi:hypothetical protein
MAKFLKLDRAGKRVFLNLDSIAMVAEESFNRNTVILNTGLAVVVNDKEFSMIADVIGEVDERHKFLAELQG